MIKSYLKYLFSLPWKELLIGEAIQYIVTGIALLFFAEKIVPPIFAFLQTLNADGAIEAVTLLAKLFLGMGFFILAIILISTTYREAIKQAIQKFKKN